MDTFFVTELEPSLVDTAEESRRRSTYSSKHASVNDTYFHSYVISTIVNKKAPLTESTEMPAGTGIAACWKPKARKLAET